jgi:esterase/lipase
LGNDIEYYPTSLPKKSAITVVAHGLNVIPVAMLPLINWLTGLGSDAYLIKLSGHHEKAAHIKDVTSSVWQKEMLSGYKVAKEAAFDNSVPLFFLGYSLGALLGQSMIALSQQGALFDKQILIAPATAIRRRSYLVKLLFLFGKGIRLPSYTPKGYRVNESLPLGIYQIMFAEEKKVLKAKFNGLNFPTIILIDPKDELISYKKLIKFIIRFRLTNYRIIVLDDKLKGRKEKYHHLILNEQTMGKANWEMATQKMEKFFFKE